MTSKTSAGPAEIRRSPVYRYQDNLYVNLTNKCPTACRFCVKFTWKMMYRGYDLRLENRDPSVEEIMAAARSAYAERPFQEAVFCGYGESTYRLKEMLEVCDRVHEELPGVRTRLNTIGLGDLIHKRSISADLAGHVDAVSISLNTADPEQWAEIHQPIREFKENGFQAVLNFIGSCAAAVCDTTVTAVDYPDINIEAVRAQALSRGAKFRLRPVLEESA